ncbi:MAG: hypothetical protein J0I20_12345 [Chloroflexi bacterium]|nr:hypothetical protein [Chloroflexota bacterium]OJV92511.1 MAG: hypothetical protein BGO39_31855 [Chloroflexi bacterium 54-19]
MLKDSQPVTAGSFVNPTSTTQLNQTSDSTDRISTASLFGVFFIAMALIMLELILTRIFSVTIYYHFAFMAVSLALLGTAVSGVWVYIMPKWFSKARYSVQAPIAAILFAVTTCAALILYISIPFLPTADWGDLLKTALIYMALSIPFFFGGLCVSLPLSHYPKQASRIYFFDLLGASIGCLLTIVVLTFLGGPTAVLFVAALGAIGALVMSLAVPRRNLRLLSTAVSVIIVALVVLNLATNVIKISYAKGEYEGTKYYEHWNTFSRIVVVDPPAGTQPVWGLSPAYNGTFPPFYLMNIDAQAGTPIIKWDGNPKSLDFLKWDVSTVVHSLKTNANQLIIGAGGGKDIMAGLLFNQKKITGVEINPDIINAVKNQYGDYTGNFYKDPRVNIVVEEGRTYLTQTSEKYDIIQASLIDSWAATSAGAFALTENSLYTDEAFKIYWNRLNDGGMLSMSRFYSSDRPDETLRLLTLGLESWREQGVTDPRQNIAVMYSGGIATVLFKKGPGFTPDEVSILQKRALQYGFSLLYAPGATPDAQELYQAGPIPQLMAQPDYNTFVKNYPLDISPPTDNRPFFFHTLRFGDSIKAMLGMQLPPEAQNVHSKAPLSVLGALLIIVTIMAALFIFGPLLAMRRKKTAGANQNQNKERRSIRDNIPYILYFLLIGLGFLMVELPLIQRFSLFLGQPVYALAVTLFSILLFSSLGSFSTDRVMFLDARRRLIIAGVGLSILLPVYIVLLPVILEALTGLPMLVKAVISVIILAPMAFLMGMPFPLGVKLMSQNRAWMVPWVWGINGACSVVASVVSVVIAIYYGFSMALALGTACYFCLLLLALFSRVIKQATTETEAQA